MEPLAAALAGRPSGDHELLRISGASHNLKLVSNPADPGFSGLLAPEASRRLREWLSSKLASAEPEQKTTGNACIEDHDRAARIPTLSRVDPTRIDVWCKDVSQSMAQPMKALAHCDATFPSESCGPD